VSIDIAHAGTDADIAATFDVMHQLRSRGDGARMIARLPLDRD
jgi:hypothetical protein